MIFIILSIIELFGELLNNKKLILYTKPLLIPALYLENYHNVPYSILVGLIFATFGDIVLLGKQHIIYFGFGIILFMVNHFSYLYYFYMNSLVKLNVIYLLSICYLEYRVGRILLWNIRNKIIKYMVLIYIILLGKTLYSILLFDNYNILLGYSSFVVSDILLGYQINRYIHYSNLYNVMIMLTYLFGQYMIITNIFT
jgi:uncharacterized membrane protein YhhN